MISFRKIAAAAGSGKTLAAYLRETTTVQDANRKLAAYYGGWDAAGTWRRDMSQEVASALGIDRRKPPTDEALERLFEARRADTGERWTKQKREISAVDLTASPHKSVTLAYVGAKSEAERAALLQAVWRANDYAMHAFASRLGRSRKGRGGRNGVVPADVAWCSFMHFTARPTHEVQDGKDGPTTIRNATVASDPQIHIHNPWWNLTVCEDGSLGSIELGQLRHVKEFGGMFQARAGRGAEGARGPRALRQGRVGDRDRRHPGPHLGPVLQGPGRDAAQGEGIRRGPGAGLGRAPERPPAQPAERGGGREPAAQAGRTRGTWSAGRPRAGPPGFGARDLLHA